METINKKNNQITFSAEIEESLANAIRRYINQIPVLAIDELEISKNDSALYDETIAHRMGLIPLKTNKSVNEKTTSEIKLDVKKEGMVYSEKITGGAEVVYGKIPITLLNNGQELSLVATVKAGKGSEHSKFSPGLMFYRNIVELKIDKDCPQEVVNFCPQNILKLENGKVIVEDNSKCDMCEACVEIPQKQGKDSIKLIPTKELAITIESFGQMETNEIFNKSLDVLKNNISHKLNRLLKKKNLFFAEGLTTYFSEKEYLKFITQIQPFLSSKNNVFFSQENFLKKSSITYKILRKIVVFLTKNRSYLKFETKEDLINYLKQKGFEDCQGYYKNNNLFYRIN